MIKEKVLTAVDIGSSEVKVAIGAPQYGSDDVQILGLGCSPSKGVKKGVVININDTLKDVSQAISDAEEMAGRQADNIYGSISGTHVKGEGSRGLVAVRGGEIDKRDKDEVIRSCTAIKIDPSREILHALPQEFIVDGMEGVKDPIGISGVRLEAKIYLVTAGVTSERNVLKCINQNGYTVNDLIASPVASAAAVLRDDEKELGVLMLDIGAGTTDVIVYKDGAVQYIDVIANAGNNITSMLATNIKTSISIAENIKKSYSLNSGSFSKRMIDVGMGGGRTEISARAVAEMIEVKVKDLFRQIKERVDAVCDFPISCIVLCGGTANLRGIDSFAEDIFQAPARVAQVREASGLADLIKDPRYATISGILRLSNLEDNCLRQTMNKKVGPMGFFRKIGDWLCENF